MSQVRSPFGREMVGFKMLSLSYCAFEVRRRISIRGQPDNPLIHHSRHYAIQLSNARLGVVPVAIHERDCLLPLTVSLQVPTWISS